MISYTRAIKIQNPNLFHLPPAGVNVPKPGKPVVADDAGAKFEPNPNAGFCANKPPGKKVIVNLRSILALLNLFYS